MALSKAAVLCFYSASWRFAAYLIVEERAEIGGVFRYRKSIITYCTIYIISDKCRVFSAVIITAQMVTYALDGAPSASKAYDSGRKLLSIMSTSETSVDYKQKKQVRMFICCTFIMYMQYIPSGHIIWTRNEQQCLLLLPISA